MLVTSTVTLARFVARLWPTYELAYDSARWPSRGEWVRVIRLSNLEPQE
jgi:hypothetical protein